MQYHWCCFFDSLVAKDCQNDVFVQDVCSLSKRHVIKIAKIQVWKNRHHSSGFVARLNWIDFLDGPHSSPCFICPVLLAYEFDGRHCIRCWTPLTLLIRSAPDVTQHREKKKGTLSTTVNTVGLQMAEPDLVPCLKLLYVSCSCLNFVVWMTLTFLLIFRESISTCNTLRANA